MPAAGRSKGTPKTGGRKRGTPNKTTVIYRQLGLDIKKDGIIPILQSYIFGTEIPPQIKDSPMMQDLLGAKPAEALNIIERLMQYVLPKMQSTSVDVTSESQHTIEDTLIALSAEK